MSGAAPTGKVPIRATLALLVAALAALQLIGPEPGLLYLAPALLLLAALAFDRYPGERLLAALAGAGAPARRRMRPAPSRPTPPRRSFPRGGVLLALALAGRGPPA